MIQVQLKSNWSIMAPDYVMEFDGKTGRLVYVVRSAWGGFQMEVELDEPHSIFGKFAKCVYSYPRENEVVARLMYPYSFTDVLEMDEIIHGNHRRYHDQKGDPLPWEQVKQLLIEDHRRLHENNK